MYEAYIEARDSPLRDVKDYCMNRHMDPKIYDNTNIPRNNKIEIDRNSSLLIKPLR